MAEDLFSARLIGLYPVQVELSTSDHLNHWSIFLPSCVPSYLLLLSEGATWGPLNKTNSMKSGVRIQSLVIHVQFR